MTVYHYATLERTGIRHVVQQNWAGAALSRTLCGRLIEDDGWTLGDETQSPIAATCNRCKSLASFRWRRQHGGALPREP